MHTYSIIISIIVIFISCSSIRGMSFRLFIVYIILILEFILEVLIKLDYYILRYARWMFFPEIFVGRNRPDRHSPIISVHCFATKTRKDTYFESNRRCFSNSKFK